MVIAGWSPDLRAPPRQLPVRCRLPDCPAVRLLGCLAALAASFSQDTSFPRLCCRTPRRTPLPDVNVDAAVPETDAKRCMSSAFLRPPRSYSEVHRVPGRPMVVLTAGTVNYASVRTASVRVCELCAVQHASCWSNGKIPR